MSTLDIINAAANEDPSTFRDELSAELNNRIAAAIELKRQEVATNMFGSIDDDSEEGDDE
jgi:hypothetical protein